MGRASATGDDAGGDEQASSDEAMTRKRLHNADCEWRACDPQAR